MKALAWIGVVVLQTTLSQVNLLDKFQAQADLVHFWCLHWIQRHCSDWNWFYEAILIGEDKGLRQQSTLQPFFILGLYHLIVVSGSHVIALQNLVEKLTFFLPRSARKGCVVVCLLAFTFANQLQASCSRAFFQWCLSQLPSLKHTSNADLQMIITCFCLCLEPRWATSLSFQLSCGATLGLAIAGQFRVNGALSGRLASSLSCTLVTCPLIFYVQPCLSWLVIPANTLALPLFETVLMPISLFNVFFPWAQIVTEKIFVLVFGISEVFSHFENPVLCFDGRRSGIWGFVYLSAVYFCWRFLLPALIRQRFWNTQSLRRNY